ncbi:Hypothetical Protein PANA_3400 [Pantoea ananatis LMG 20103]|uniref:Uncharacterized protein n=1 Tax=Pantoea ananatis (strain LMG 20103) TaxID=706191 RepID=D4GN75_PANAM|nr:Hypothetical Protein PANA_3400 [Pantoea ananatis LMG 20103]
MKNAGNIGHQVIDRQIAGPAYAADFADKKPITLPPRAIRSTGSSALHSALVSDGMVMRGSTINRASTSDEARSASRTPRSAPAVGFTSST